MLDERQGSLMAVGLLCAGAKELKELIFTNREVVAWTATAHNVLGFGGFINTIHQQGAVNMHGHHLTKHHPTLDRLSIGFEQLVNLRASALKGHGAFGYTGHINEGGR